MKLPQFIALVGLPKSGKSEVQTILHQHFNVLPVDDGEPMRLFAMDFLGLSEEDVYSQEGKLRTTVINGHVWENRKILGELGRALETLFGADILPWIATRGARLDQSYSFGSVRMKQPWFYKRAGGVVIGIRRPGTVPTGNSWDEFDVNAVDVWIDNDGTLDQLLVKVTETMERLAWRQVA